MHFKSVLVACLIASCLGANPVYASVCEGPGKEVGPGMEVGPGEGVKIQVDNLELYGLTTGYDKSLRALYIKEYDDFANSEDGSFGLVSKGVGDIQKFSAFGTYRYFLGSDTGGGKVYYDAEENYRVEYKEPGVGKISAEQHRIARDKIAEIVAGCTKDLDGVKLFYDRLTKLDYNMENDQPYDLLTTGSGNCHAFALSFANGLDQMGIEAYYVLGYNSVGGFHAWNSFRIDGKIYTVDASEAAMNRDLVGDDIMWQFFLEDSSMTLGDGRTITDIY